MTPLEEEAQEDLETRLLVLEKEMKALHVLMSSIIKWKEERMPWE